MSETTAASDAGQTEAGGGASAAPEKPEGAAAPGTEAGTGSGDPAAQDPAGAAKAPPSSGDGPGAEPAPAPEGFMAHLDPEVAKDLQPKGYKTANELAKAYLKLESKIGEKGIIKPGEDAPQEDWDAYYAAIGRPESPENYDLGEFQPPEGVPWNEEAQQGFLQAMHKAGAPQAAVQAALDYYGSFLAEQQEALQTQAEEETQAAERELRKEFGRAYDERLDLANRVVREFGGKELAAELEKSGFGRNKTLVKALASIGEAMSEDGELIGSVTAKGFGLNQQDARKELDSLTKDPEKRKILTDNAHPEHQDLIARRKRLYELAYPAGGEK
ncbi:hypothetical protein [Fodinicurvata sediminis]|uniref:hypothetical protein n=1 Tax=Fodinicurvata sediminis TaxID=1121832 RepID=UPI0003B534DF|nr:hypothetical protein [Fodinicurvata sediminis]